MKKGVLIVNNARGALVDTQAMVDACNSGHVAGLTVFCTLVYRRDPFSSRKSCRF